jgi:N-acetylmuramic acid 6-phosphate etherase
VKILIAGGQASLSNMAGKIEDDANAAISDMKKANISSRDCVMCVSASGTTPYAVGALKFANAMNIKTVAIANNFDIDLLNEANVAIYLDTPAEIISGSTRLGAATAQKIALNMMSTLMAIHLGHVHDGYMVNVRADNKKLKRRAIKIVSEIAKCENNMAQEYIEKADGSVKLAILLAAGSPDLSSAKEILENNDQKLRSSLSVIKGSFML